MVMGIGTDVIEVERIKKAVQRSERFMERIFSENERQLFEERKGDIRTIAANFAGKEAVLKVFGTGIRGCEWREIEVLRETSGRPYVVLKGRASELADLSGVGKIMISLSHTNEYAVAFAIGLRG